MIKFQATATIHYISPVQEIPSKTGGQPFQKRELVLNDSWEKDGKQYPSFVLVEFSGDKMSLLDQFAPGHRVTVEGVINGREYNGRYYNTVKGLSIAPYQAQQSYAPTPAYPQQPPQPSYPPQQAYPPQPPYPQQTAYPQQPPVATGYPPMPGNNGYNPYPH